MKGFNYNLTTHCQDYNTNVVQDNFNDICFNLLQKVVHLLCNLNLYNCIFLNHDILNLLWLKIDQKLPLA